MVATSVAATRSGVTRRAGTGWAVVRRLLVPSSWLTNSGPSTAWSVVTVLVRPEVHVFRITEKKANLFTEYRRPLCRLLILNNW